MAQSEENSPSNLDRYRWENRIVLIFAPNESYESYQQQVEEFSDKVEGFQDRHLLTFHLFDEGESFVDESAISPTETKRLFKKFDIKMEQFTVILIGKDGTEKLRSVKLLPTEKLFSVIDAMPMRQREMQENH